MVVVGGGPHFPAALSPQVQMKSALNNPFVSSWLSRRGDSASLLQVRKQQQSRPAACRSLPPLNDRQRSCQIDSLGRVELISHFRWGKYLHRSAAYSAVLILHNFVLLPPVTLRSFTQFVLFLQGFPDVTVLIYVLHMERSSPGAPQFPS